VINFVEKKRRGEQTKTEAKRQCPIVPLAGMRPHIGCWRQRESLAWPDLKKLSIIVATNKIVFHCLA
jgi:hypothetical protein